MQTRPLHQFVQADYVRPPPCGSRLWSVLLTRLEHYSSTPAVALVALGSYLGTSPNLLQHFWTFGLSTRMANPPRHLSSARIFQPPSVHLVATEPSRGMLLVQRRQDWVRVRLTHWNSVNTGLNNPPIKLRQRFHVQDRIIFQILAMIPCCNSRQIVELGWALGHTKTQQRKGGFTHPPRDWGKCLQKQNRTPK